MTDHDKASQEDRAERQALFDQTIPAIAEAVLDVEYGTVTLNVRSGRIFMLEVTRRQRFDQEDRDAAPRQD